MLPAGRDFCEGFFWVWFLIYFSLELGSGVPEA